MLKNIHDLYNLIEDFKKSKTKKITIKKLFSLKILNGKKIIYYITINDIRYEIYISKTSRLKPKYFHRTYIPNIIKELRECDKDITLQGYLNV